jgi:hypothetical protein
VICARDVWEQVVIAAQSIGAVCRTAITPHHPVHDIAAMLLTHLAAEQWPEQLVIIDEIVEPAQPALEPLPPPAQS